MTPAWPTDLATRWSRRALGLASRLVPAASRTEWRHEWDAELWHLRRPSASSGPLRLVVFVLGAFWHALWERKEGWRLESVRQDVRYGLRTLVRSPGFAASAALMLALSIGASTALFSVIEASLLATPPFPQADRLVVVDTLFGMPGGPMGPSEWSYRRFQALRDDVQSIEDLSGYELRTMTLTEMGSPEVIGVETVSPSIFPLLGVQAARGRVFGRAEEDDGTADLVAVVGHAFWRTRLGSAPDVVGRTVTLDQLRFQIVGVLPEGFEGLTGGADAWIPFSALREVENPGALDDAWNQYFSVVGRLAPGVSIETARSEVETFGATITTRFPAPVGATRIVASAGVVPYREARMNPLARTSMLALFAAVVLVLLIATANLAGLLLARGASRQREAAIRVSLGAGRSRLVRQLLTESLTLAAVGGGLGLVAAWFGVGVLGAWLGDAIGTSGGRGLEYLDPDVLSINWRVLVFAIVLTGGVGIAFGLLPAWQAARTDPNASLKSDRRTVVGSAGPGGRGGLIVVQVAVALVLLAGASLMMRSLANMQRVDLGYDPDNLLTAIYSLTPADEQAGIDSGTFHGEFLERVRGLAGVVGVTLGEVPMGGPTRQTLVMGSEGRPELNPAMHVRIRMQAVADGHFGVLGTRVVMGRDIEFADDDRVDRVIVLNETAAAELFPEGSPLGRRIQLPWPGYLGMGATVVGVVADQQLGEPGRPRELQGFVPFRQAPQLDSGLLVRTDGRPGDLAAQVRATLADLNPNIALTSVMSMRDRAAGVTARPRIVTMLLGVFGAVSLFLVAAGLYGTIAFAVARRTRELGLRASLGADRLSLAMLVLRQGIGVTLAGILVGVVGATWATRYLQGLLFGTDGLDPAVLIGVSVLLFGVALLAAYIPARRAMRIDPMVALRAE